MCASADACICQHLQALLADLDIRDLKKAALPSALTDINASSTSRNPAQASPAQQAGVRVATIDNYQVCSVRYLDCQPANLLARPSLHYCWRRPCLVPHSRLCQYAYQGEEADVVVASLVRCNKAGRVGFLREPERINVLLSRARQGLIIIGSAHTLRNASNPAARKHWGVVLDLLEASGKIVSGLPAVCQRHGRQLQLLDSPEAFRLHAPGATAGC